MITGTKRSSLSSRRERTGFTAHAGHIELGDDEIDAFPAMDMEKFFVGSGREDGVLLPTTTTERCLRFLNSDGVLFTVSPSFFPHRASLIFFAAHLPSKEEPREHYNAH